MVKTCPHCGSNSIEVDDAKSTEFCSDCGAVVAEGSFQDESTRNDSQSFYSNNFSLEKRDWRMKKWNTTVNPELANYRMTKRVQEQTERLHLPQDYVPQVVEMMKSIYIDGRKPPRIKGLPKNKTPVIASCIYIICRRNGVLIYYRNVAEAARCKRSVVWKCATLISNFFNIALKEPREDEILENVLSQLDVKDPAIKELAFELNQFCSETLIRAGKSKLLTTIGIAQICIESVQGKPVKFEKLKEVCKLYVCTPINMRKNFYSIKEELVKYGKQIPWLKNLTTFRVTKFIKEIISFYKECQDHRSVDIKLEWEKKKEEAELNKERVIREVKERVDACHKHCGKKVPLSDEDILHKKCKASHSTQVRSLQEETSSSEVEVTPKHICCPHCCVNLKNCPKYKNNGRSDFCDLNSTDRMIEYLMRKDYSESDLMSGNPESMFCDVFYHLDSEGDREELDDQDIGDSEMHLYIKTEPEVLQAKIHSLFLKKNEDGDEEEA